MGCGAGLSREKIDAAQSKLNEQELTKARNTAYNYLSFRPRSRSEVERKLQEKGFPVMVVQAVLTGLDRLGYVDDREFAREWARSRVRLRGFGRRRIEQELRKKGVGGDIIGEVVARIFENSPEIDIARREAGKKLKTLTRFAPEVRRRRLAGFLERKGFSPEIIYVILQSNTM